MAKKYIYHANTNWKKAGVAILISDKADFKIRKLQGINRALNNDKGINSKKM